MDMDELIPGWTQFTEDAATAEEVQADHTESSRGIGPKCVLNW
jgi:hypothetical protein